MNTRTNKELNRIIAEWMGWYENMEDYPGHPDNPVKAIVTYPNFCQDLNAIHEAEKKLDGKQWNRYPVLIARAVLSEWDTHVKVFAPTNVLLGATARQRAEALVSVIEQEKQKV